ncbi:MAG: hypothetical protein K9M45_06715 [Kiritimatiellales bacterium]|nr:hypothetical protein [Kiritimatiellales bacterium]
MSKAPIKRGDHKAFGIEKLVLAVILLVLAVSAVFVYLQIKERGAKVSATGWLNPGEVNTAKKLKQDSILNAIAILDRPVQAGKGMNHVLSSEPRVVAVGSAYPIPFEATVCPFSGIEQPSMDLLDRDGDGMTDVWEEKYQLDKYRPADAGLDMDHDGFTNLEEFSGGTNPTDLESHPVSAAKLRFAGAKVREFKLKFLALTELPDDRRIFQLNLLSLGKTYFKEIGEDVEDAVVKAYFPKSDTEEERLVLERGGKEIVLPKGVVVREPESQAELINLLDMKTAIVTMGQLLSIYDDVYTVVGIDTNNATVRLDETGELYKVVELSEEERVKFFGRIEGEGK